LFIIKNQVKLGIWDSNPLGPFVGPILCLYSS